MVSVILFTLGLLIFINTSILLFFQVIDLSIKYGLFLSGKSEDFSYSMKGGLYTLLYTLSIALMYFFAEISKTYLMLYFM